MVISSVSSFGATSEVLHFFVDVWVRADTDPIERSTRTQRYFCWVQIFNVNQQNPDFECCIITVLILKTESTCLPINFFIFLFFSEEPSLKPNLDTKTNIVFYKRTRMSRGEVPAVNIELCVCVFRARSMTEQQEQSEETGLVSTQDLDHSKDDDTHGHFRQISHTQTHTLFCNTCCLSMLFFFTHTPSASCAWSWVTALGDLFSQHLFCAFISDVFDLKQ